MIYNISLTLLSIDPTIITTATSIKNFTQIKKIETNKYITIVFVNILFDNKNIDFFIDKIYTQIKNSYKFQLAYLKIQIN